MRAITNLISWSTLQYNNIYANCCDNYFEVTYKLDPGESDHEVWLIYAYAFGAGTNIQIIEAAGIPYTTTFGATSSAALSPTFILTQGNELTIKYRYCSNVAIGANEQIQLTLTCNNHAIPDHSFSFKFRGRDIVADYTSFIAEQSAVFTNCTNDCDTIKDLLHLNNPSSLPIHVTSTLSTTCGFNFFIDGNPIDITDFQLPVGQSVLQINNPGCVVPAPCDFDILFDFCGNTLNIPITHDITYCNSCGIDCRGITISSNPISMPKVAIAPDFDYGPTIFTPSNSTWIWGQNSGGAYTPTYSTSGIRIDYPSTIGFTESFIGCQLPNSYTYSPTFTAGDALTFYWYFETGNISNNTWEVSYSGLLTGGSPINLIPAGTILPNTVYQGTISIPSFVDPGIVTYNQGYYDIRNYSLVNGDYIEVKNVRFQLQQVVKQILLPQIDLDCSTLNSYNATSIGDAKEITFQYYYHNGFADFSKVYFNPWAFDATADFHSKYPGGVITEPYSGFVVDVMSSWIGTGLQEMNFLGPNNQKNYKAYINLIDGNQFEIVLQFFFIQDLLDWVDLYDTENRRKLLYSSADISTLELTNTANSVYLQTKAFGYLIYIYDTNYIVGYTNTVPPKPIAYECYADNKVMFDVRWWNQGLNGGLPEMSNHSFSFSRNSNPVTQLSSIRPTTASFDVYYNGTIDHAIFWLFDTSQNDNTIDFYDNYDSSRALIPTSISNGVIDHHIEGPSVAVTNLGSGHYYVSATISKNINPNGQYRLAAICYDTTNDIVNSFLSDSLSVKNTVDLWDVCCDMSVDVHWYDYNNDYNDPCFMPTVKERIKNDMYIDAGPFQTCLENLGMPVGANWLDYMEAVILNIYIKRDTYPTPTQRTYFMYATYGALRDTSITGNWDLTNASPYLTVGESGSTLYTSWTGRVLWNDTPFTPSFTRSVQVSDMTNWMDRSLATGVNATNYANFHNITYNWADQDVYFEYLFKFDLTSFLPTAPPLFLAQINQLHPMGFEPVSPTYTEIITDVVIEGWDGSTLTPITGSFCLANYDYLKVTTTLDASYTDGILIATLNYYPYTEFDIKEHETAPAIQISMMSDPEMFNVDSNFTAGNAVFFIDCSQLSAGDYEICSIRIKE
jgi:hypothetical protein